MTRSRETVQAAGAVLWRRRKGDTEVALVHRPKYDDWSFPKGKLDPGETHEEAAVREVEEETACRGLLGDELPGTSYVDGKGRPKVVRYWTMVLDERGRFEPNDEVDEVRWFAVDRAARRLSYDHDVAVLESFAAWDRRAHD
jgi:8-oxo-dGTP pyrophosphatase MutT (NUDIX family)